MEKKKKTGVDQAGRNDLLCSFLFLSRLHLFLVKLFPRMHFELRTRWAEGERDEALKDGSSRLTFQKKSFSKHLLPPKEL